MRVSVTAAVDVDGPAERAFAAMVDLRSQDRWVLLTKLYALAGDAPVPQVGSRIAAMTAVAGIGVFDTMQVTVYDPPHRWETQHDGGLIKGRGVFAVEPTARGLRAVWVEEVDLPLGILGRIGWIAVKPLVRWGLSASLRTLAAGLQQGYLPVDGAKMPAAVQPAAPGSESTTGPG